jgi:SPP1 gp7 family putative phage head morphogenesis protein
MARSRRPSPFANARRAENEYRRHLQRIVRHIEDMLRGIVDDSPESWRRVEDLLRQYAALLDPWARAVATRMIEEVARKDANAYFARAREMGVEIRHLIETTPTGATMQRLLDEQVHLITSLPLDAAQHVHKQATEGLSLGTRWETIARSIMETGEVSRSRANTIARTETGRAATTLTQVRAESIGSPGYIWRAVMDRVTRPRHRELNGNFILWTQPPIATDDGQAPVRAHAGAIYNCRCYPEPVLAGETPQEGPIQRNPAFLQALRDRGITTGAVFE